MYGVDASRYEEDAAKKLYIRRIYDMIPSQMENKKKRIVAKDILDRKGDRFSNYVEEFEYLINSGITIPSHAISNPKYPLAESRQKNLLKLYMNDVGMLTSQLYHYNIQPILNDIASINLGSVYESAVAKELKAHYEKLFYYDNKQKGEVDFLVDDNGTMSVLLIEVKSGKDYTVHSALDNLMSIQDYHIVSSIVLSNEREIKTKGNILYLPIYYVMFLEKKGAGNFAGLAIGLTLVLVHIVCIPITGTSVNPARSIAPALFAGGEALSQLWLFIVAPFFGSALSAMVWKGLMGDNKE